MFTSTEHAEGRPPPWAHLPAVCRGLTVGFGSDWSNRRLPKTQGRWRLMIVEAIKRKVKEKYVPLDFSISTSLQQRCFWVEEGTTLMGNTQTTVNYCNTINKLHSIHPWLISIVFYQLVQSEHWKLFSTLLHLLLLHRQLPSKNLSVTACSCPRQWRSCSGKVWPWTYLSF